MKIRESITMALGIGLNLRDERAAERSAARRPRPRPNFARIPRSKFEQHCAHLDDQLARAKGETRAVLEWVAAYLERVADAHDADARHLEAPQRPRPGEDIKPGALGATGHRAVADTLRDIANDFERGPEL